MDGGGGGGVGRLPTSKSSSWVGFAFSFRLSVIAFSKAGVLVTIFTFLLSIGLWLAEDRSISEVSCWLFQLVVCGMNDMGAQPRTSLPGRCLSRAHA